MKNLVTAIIFCIVAFSNTKGQNKDSVVTLPTVTITSYTMVNKELDKSFLHNFPDAYDIVWSRLNKDYIAKFIKDDLKHQSLFKKNGFLKYDITYVEENHLPADIRQNIKAAYDSHKISNGARIRRSNQDFWIVNLEGLTNYIVVRVENGDLEEVKRIQKSE